MKKNHFFTRRDFLHRTAAIGAAISIPSIVPSTVFGANAPSNRITMGMVGMGLQMGGHLRGMLSRRDVQVVAVCDVDQYKRESAKQSVESSYGTNTASGTYKGCEAYNEYEKYALENRTDQLTSEFLVRSGISGVRYPTGTLSGVTDSPYYNYTVFDEDVIDIIQRMSR